MESPVSKKIAAGYWGLFAISAILTSLTLAALISLSPEARADDFIVYSVYQTVDLGNPGETISKDYYVNMGSAQGLRPGSILEVARKTSTYDLTSEKLYKDVSFPIGKLKVLHVEGQVAIARLDAMYAEDKTPAISPRSVMVGDLVRSQR